MITAAVSPSRSFITAILAPSGPLIVECSADDFSPPRAVEVHHSQCWGEGIWDEGDPGAVGRPRGTKLIDV